MSENDSKKGEKPDEGQMSKEEGEVLDQHSPDIKVRVGEWMLKPCWMYKDEYKECNSLRGKFQQYFIHGEFLDCSQWKTDWKNCDIWKDKDDDTAYNSLLESEKERRLQRLRGSAKNNIWQPRDAPPKDWAEPLPEWMEKRNVGTFLSAKQREIDETGRDDEYDLYVPSCTII